MINLDARLKDLPVGTIWHLTPMGDPKPYRAAVNRYRRKYGGVWEARICTRHAAPSDVWITRIAPDFPTGRTKWPFMDMAIGETVTLDNVPYDKAANAAYQVKHKHGMVFEVTDVRVAPFRYVTRVTRTH